jgi:TRAP-type C4-dicarboxylate transport system substrate-binding protein
MPWISPIMMSEKGFQRLDPPIREALFKAAQEAAQLEQEWGVVKEKEFQEALVEKGMTMCELEDTEIWKEKSRAIWPELYEKVGGRELADLAVQSLQ